MAIEQPDDFEPWQPEQAQQPDDFEPWGGDEDVARAYGGYEEKPHEWETIRGGPQAPPDDFVPWQPEPEAEGKLATGVRSFAHSVLPGLASVPAFVAGSATPLGPIGGLAAGAAAFAGAHKLQESALNAMGFDDSQQQAVNARENPWSSFAGDVASGVASFGAGPARLATRGIGAIAGGGLEAINQTLGGQDLDPGRIAAGAAAGAVLTRPRALTEAIGSRTAAAIGRPELWHGAAGPDAAAGTSKEQPPPSAKMGEPQPVNTDTYGKQAPQVFEGETPPTAGPRVTPIEADPAVAQAIRGEPIGPRVTEGEAPAPAERGPPPQVMEEPTQYGALLDKEFPRVPQPQVTKEPDLQRAIRSGEEVHVKEPGESDLAFEKRASGNASAREQLVTGRPTPELGYVDENGNFLSKGEAEARTAAASTASAETPVMENLARTPREAMEQKAPDETYGQVLRRLASDERGGERLPARRVLPREEPGFTPEELEALDAKSRKLFNRQIVDNTGKANDVPPEIAAKSIASIREFLGENVTPVASRTLRSVLGEFDHEHQPEWARGFTKEYIKQLNDRVGDTPIHFVNEADLADYWKTHPLRSSDSSAPGGLYDSHSKTIVINNDYREMNTVLHEATHAVARQHIETKPEFKREIRLLMDYVERQANKSDFTRYAMHNEHEFLSEAFSNPDFQYLLKNTTLPTMFKAQLEGKGVLRSLWDGFIESLRRTMGFEPNMKARDMLEHVLEFSSYEARDAYKSARAESEAFERSIMAAPRRPTREEPGAGPVHEGYEVERQGVTTGRFPNYRLVVDGVDLGKVQRKVTKGRDVAAGRGQPAYDSWAIHGTELGSQAEAESKLIERAVKFGTLVKKLATDERGGGRIGRGPTAEEPGAGPVAKATEEALPPSELPTATQVRRMSRQQLTDLAHEIGVGERKIASSKTVSNLSRHVLDRVEEINKNRTVAEALPAAEAMPTESGLEITTLRNKRDMSGPDSLIAMVNGKAVASAAYFPNHAAFTVINKVTGERASAINSTEARQIMQKWFKQATSPAAEAMPTPRVMEGEAIPGAKAKADAALTARGFTPEQITAMTPKAKEAILQKREGEIGSKPERTAEDIEIEAEHGKNLTLAEMDAQIAKMTPREIADDFYAGVGRDNHAAALEDFDQSVSKAELKKDPKLAAARKLIEAKARAEKIVRGPAPGEAPAAEAKINDDGGRLTIDGSRIEAVRHYKNQDSSFSGWVVRKGGEISDPITTKAKAIETMRAWHAEDSAKTSAAEALDLKLANRMLNQPAVLRSEAAKRGITPEALKAQATEALKTAPAAPLPGRPAEMSPVGGEKIATETPEYQLARRVLSDPAVLRAEAKKRGMTLKALSNEALAQVRVAETTPAAKPAAATPVAAPAAAPPGKPPKPPNKPPTVGQAAAAAGGTPPPPPSGPASMVYAPRQKRSDLGDLVRSVKLLVGGDIGPMGRQATELIRRSYGNLNRVYEQGHALLERHREQVFNTSEADRWKINDKIENGATTRNWQPSPEQQTLINDTKSVMDHWKEQLQGLDRTKQMDFVENYLPHMYENPDQARDFFNSWGKRGGAGSTKKRTMPTYQDAIDAGLKPLTSDPIELAQRYGLSMKHFIASNDVLERAVNTGVAGYFKSGKSIGASGSPSPLQVGGPPPGWKRLNAPPNAKGHELYAPEDFADKYNAFYNKGFFGGAHAPIYNAARNANSAWTSLELGLNPYHFFTMVNEAMISDIAKGFDQMFSGQFTKGTKSIRNSPIAGRTRYVEGRRFQQEYLNPNSTDPIASVVSEANARPIGKGHALDVLGSPNDPRTPVRGSFLKNFSSENINFEVRKAIEEFKQDFDKAGTSYERVKFAGKQMSRMLQTVGAPIFDKYIPALKAGALHSHMEAWFDANSHIDPRNMTPEQRQQAVKAAIKYTDTIDNRFGEMIHDNTFMNKTMQQAATVLMRSFSWTVGAMREIAGGSVAGVKAFSALGRGENKFSMRHPEYDPRIAYVAALGAGVSITSAIYQYLHTGELPQDINDLYAPKTGGTVPGLGGKGQVPEHVLMPGFHKDVYGWLTHPLSEAYAKGSGLATTSYEQLTNEDWRGDPIYRRGADPVEHMTQRASHLFGRFGPISIKNMIKGQPDTSGISSTETALGFRAPGAAIQDPQQLENWMRVKSEREWEAKQRHERTAAKKYERTANASNQ